MSAWWLVVLIIVASGAGALAASEARASSSEEFYRVGEDIHDEWGIARTRAGGSDGFLGVTSAGFDPLLAPESLGQHVDVAWDLGQELARKYPDRNQRAERIFTFVRDRVVYTSDRDQFGTDEYAQNADEVAATIVKSRSAKGDCEDSSILLAIMYKAAGYRSAVVLVPGHVATLVHLPDYKKAPRKLMLGGEPGWVWAEATGATNPFGWVPEALLNGPITAREVMAGELRARPSGATDVTLERVPPPGGSGGAAGTGLWTLLGVGGLLWVMAGRRGGMRGRGRHP